MGIYSGIVVGVLDHDGARWTTDFSEAFAVLGFLDAVIPVKWCMPQSGSPKTPFCDIAAETLRAAIPPDMPRIYTFPAQPPTEHGGVFTYSWQTDELREEGNAGLLHLALPPCFLPKLDTIQPPPRYGWPCRGRFALGWTANPHGSFELSFAAVSEEVFVREAPCLQQAIRAINRPGVAPPGAEPQLEVQSLQTPIPSSVWHLHTPDDLPLLTCTVRNPSGWAKTVTLTCVVPDFSYPFNVTLKLRPGTEQVVRLLPIPDVEAVGRITALRHAMLHLEANFRTLPEARLEQRFFVQDYPVQLLARDVVIWASAGADGTMHDCTRLLAAWVTPNDELVAQMLRNAVALHPQGELVGYQGGAELSSHERTIKVREQVKAIFQALQTKGEMRYDNATISFGQRPDDFQQRVSLPATSLRRRLANCIDGAVLYASLLELADINPVIMLVPGHAFVGWETWLESRQYEFLETTMTGTKTFEEAYQAGMEKYQRWRAFLDRPLSDPDGYARLLNVRLLQKEGITPNE